MNKHDFNRQRMRLLRRAGARGLRWAGKALQRIARKAGAVRVGDTWELPCGYVVCDKRRFPTSAQAANALAALAREGGTHRRPFRAYPCPSCGGWHLSSTAQRIPLMGGYPDLHM